MFTLENRFKICLFGVKTKPYKEKMLVLGGNRTSVSFKCAITLDLNIFLKVLVLSLLMIYMSITGCTLRLFYFSENNNIKPIKLICF